MVVLALYNYYSFLYVYLTLSTQSLIIWIVFASFISGFVSIATTVFLHNRSVTVRERLPDICRTNRLPRERKVSLNKKRQGECSPCHGEVYICLEKSEFNAYRFFLALFSQSYVLQQVCKLLFEA